MKALVAFTEAQGLAPPHIEEIVNRVRLTVWLASSVDVQDTHSATQSVTQSAPADNLVQMLLLLRNGPLSSGQLREHLQLKHRAHFRTHYLMPLLQDELIEMTLPSKPSSQLQQYRLTAKGARYLKEHP